MNLLLSAAFTAVVEIPRRETEKIVRQTREAILLLSSKREMGKQMSNDEKRKERQRSTESCLLKSRFDFLF